MEDLTARIVERRERELDQQLADSLGESLENVINLPQIEKANLMNVMHINVDISVDEGSVNVVTGLDDAVSNRDSMKTKESKKRRRKSSMDDDDDFVVDNTSEKLAFVDNLDMNLLDLYSPGTSGSGRPTRQAAKRANVANKRVNLVENEGSKVKFENDAALKPQHVESITTDLEKEEPKTSDNKETIEPIEPLKQGKEESFQKDYAETISYINSKLKSPALLEHVTPNISKIFSDLDSLPVFDMNKLKVPVTCCDPKEIPAFLKHNFMLKTISSHGTVCGANSSNLSEPVTMHKILATKRKILKVNLSKDSNGDKLVDDEIEDILNSNENSNEALVITDSSSSRETSINDAPKNGFSSSDISLGLDLRNLTSKSGFLSKPVLKTTTGTGKRLKLKPTKKKQASGGGLQIDHFYDRASDNKKKIPNLELTDAIGKILSNPKINLTKEDGSCFEDDEDDEGDTEEVKIVEEMSSPIYRRTTPRKNLKLNPDNHEGASRILELLEENDPEEKEDQGTCPICSNLFLISEIERHASDCHGN